MTKWLLFLLIILGGAGCQTAETTPPLMTPFAPAQITENGRSLTVTIYDGPQQQIISTSAETVQTALQEAGILVGAMDIVDPSLETSLSAGLTIQIRRAFPVTIAADGRIIQTTTSATSVTAVLAQAGITLAGYDYTQPNPETPLQAGAIIQVIRVTEDFRLQDEPIPFQTIWQATNQLEIDQQAIIQAGVPGITRRRVRMRYENGVEVSQTVDMEWVAQQPTNQMIGYGTNMVLRTVNTPDGPREYWRVVKMRVTSYTAASSGKEPGDPGYGYTASGYGVDEGIVAVDRSIVPFGTYVYVPGYGVGYVGDTGGGVRGRWIDLGYSEDDFIPWSGYVDVYYLTPVPPQEDINYLLPTGLP